MNRLNPRFPFDPGKWPFYYGYFVVFCSTLGFMMSVPGQTIGVSVFTDFLISHLGIGRLGISTAYMVGTVGSAFLLRRAGRFLDRAGARRVAFYAAIGLGAVLAAMSQVDRIADRAGIWMSGHRSEIVSFMIVAAGFLMLRFLGQGVMALVSRTLLMRWFVNRRGRMNSIMGVAVSLTFSGSPLFLDMLIRRFDWRGAWQFMAGIVGLGFALFALVFYRDRPEDCGLIPDGLRPNSDSSGEAVREKSWRLPDVIRTRTFWIFNLGLSMYALVLTAFTFHVVSIFETAGFSRRSAISIFLPASVISVSVNLVSGWLSDTKRFRNRLHVFLFFNLAGLLILGAGMLCLPAGFGRWLVIAGDGLASGLFGLLAAVVWARYFGPEHLGEITGYNMSFLVLFSALGPILFGLAFKMSGQYHMAVWICMAASAALLGLSGKAVRPAGPP